MRTMFSWIALTCAGCGRDKGAEGPCSDGGWGGLSAPDSAVHVSTSGSAGGSGSADDPLDTAAGALALVAESGEGELFIGPGDFTGDQLDVSEDHPDGLQIIGCGSDETVLSTDEETFLLRVADIAAEITGLGFQGGDRSVRVWQGADVTASDLAVNEPGRTGVIIIGSDTVLDLSDSTVTAPIAEATEDVGEIGYGISIDRSTVALARITVDGATSAGIIAVGDREDGNLTMEEVEIYDTSATSDGTFGRGVHIQDLNIATLSASIVLGSSDTALFAKRPQELVVRASEFGGVASADIPGESDESGDGIVVTGRKSSDDTSNPSPSAVVVELTGNTIDDVARQGVLLERVEAAVEGNTVNGALSAQDGADISGSDSVEELDEDDALLLNYDDLTATSGD